ncbi:MAG: S8 family serine peptidase, partial [Candidatus Latescibacteria bacterium]|nr:S8 family serine peptidase [Candidatus Latescibacterota bacterium]
ERFFCEPKDPKIESKVAGQIVETQGQLHLIWVFFTDKGFIQSEQYCRKVDQWEAELSVRVRSRRAKCLPFGQIVDFHDLPLCQQYIDEVQRLGVKIRHRSRWLNGLSVWAGEIQIQRLAELPFVRCIEEVRRSRGIQPLPPSRELPSLSKPSSSHFIDYGSSFWQLDQISVPELHQQDYYGQEVRICLLDSGFDNLGHRTFSQMKIEGTRDFLDGDEDVSGDGHGTKTLSVIGGFSPGYLVGPAFEAGFLLARTEDIGSETPEEEDNWIAGLEWADSLGADVVNSSLGYLDWDPGTGKDYTWEDLDGNHGKTTIAADIAVQKGIVVVNAAGNNGSDGLLNTPADGRGVITVGAVDSSGLLANFSSRGPTYDGRIKPDVVAGGAGVISANSDGSDGYREVQGTSFSAPLVA